MWYKLANLFVEANSMGMYMESLSKRIGQLAIEQIKQTEIASTVSISVGINNAINNTQMPDNIKTNIIEAFKDLDAINIGLFSSQLLTKNIRISGAEIRWKNGKHVIQLNIDYNYKTVKDFKNILQDIYESICPVIRHELEHLVQNERINPRNNNNRNKPGHDYKNYIPMNQNPYGYYMNKQEIESHVTQLYMKAKNLRRPFEMVLREFIDTQVYKILYYEAEESNQLNYSSKVLETIAQKTARKQAEDIYNAYLGYAKSRYTKKENNLQTAKVAQKISTRATGYKVVAFDKGRAYSLYNKAVTYNLTIGSMTGDTFLGTSEKFCLDYYSGAVDEQELLLTYSYDLADIVSGSADGGINGGEVRVRKARLEGYKPIPKE